MRSLEGQLLVAPANRIDPTLARAVVLVVRHNGHEAAGVIMNHPVDERVLVFNPEENKEKKSFCIAQRQLYIGGPLMGPLMAVHTNELLAEAEILPKLYFTAREHNVFALLEQSEHRYKIFAGHMGWGPDELERELEKTAWQTTPATADYVFAPGDELWEDVSWHIRETAMKDMFHTRYVPKDPQTN